MSDPMYRQIAEDLRLQIESGKLGHGDQLPTELELRKQFDASRNTVRDDEGLAPRRPTLSDPQVEIQQASGVIASELGLAEGATAVSRSQRRYIEGTPWSLSAGHKRGDVLRASQRRARRRVRDLEDGLR